MTTIDKQWKVEANFWLSHVGESGAKRFGQLVLQNLPTHEHEVELEEAHKQTSALVEGKLFEFVGLARCADNRAVVG